LVDDPSIYTPLIGDSRPARMLPGVDFWDLWPVREPDGAVARVWGFEVWAGLSAPAEGHPGARHDKARIRLVARGPDGWTDLGPLIPEGASLGSREWAGSLRLDPDFDRLDAYYTAANRRGETAPTFRQPIMGASALLQCAGGRPEIIGWSEHRELITADGVRYLPPAEATGRPGFIKAFRDPFAFRDPGSKQWYLLFTASMASSTTDFNGCVGLAGHAATAGSFSTRLSPQTR
jgi:levansucrase